MNTVTVEFRHYQDISPELCFEYQCKAEIRIEKEDGQNTYDVTLLEVWYWGADGQRETPCEFFPYAKGFDWQLRVSMENRAVEAYFDGCEVEGMEYPDGDHAAQLIEEAAQIF